MAEQQTLYGLATWLASMDEPGSVYRPTVTLQQIIDEAKLALETSRPLELELVSLRSQIEAEVKYWRSLAKQFETPEVIDATNAVPDRLQAILDSTSKEGQGHA